MRSLIFTVLAVATLVPAANASQDLARRNGCLNCHAAEATTRRMPGSTFPEMAKRYADKPDAAATLTDGLLKGTTNHPPVRSNAADTRAIIDWMFTLK